MYTSRPPRIANDEIVGGRYRVAAELGHGGMSIVYRATDLLHDKQVALKLLKLSEEEPRNLLFLQQEFRAMSRLRHPRLVQVFDYGVLDNGSSYFTMELLDGDDLSTFGPLPLESIFQVLLSIADVLAFMHARGYVHRDVKPANVRVLPSAAGQPIEVKLMDCGLTEQLDRTAHAVGGTLAYLAPEAWLGSTGDVRADLYSLGVLAYEIATGQLPFDASTGVRLLQSKTERPRDLREIRSDVPIEFARLVRDLLAPDPSHRPASAMEVVSRLCQFASIDFHTDPTVYLRTPSLVGRTRELTELRDAIEQSSTGKLGPTIILGPAGAGKTRLLDEALIEVGVRGSVIARATGRGFAGGPYEVVQDLVAPLLHLPNAEAILPRIGGKAALGMARQPKASNDSDRSLDPAAARRALHLAFTTFLSGIARRRRVVLAIDDIHLADAASIDALIALIGCDVPANIAIVATQRLGEPISQSLAHLLTVSKRLDLERMDRAQIAELIGGALGPTAPNPTLIEDIERVTGGNVYFVLEILRDLASRGLIVRKRARTTLPDALDIAALPRSLSEALERRMGLLPPTALALVRIGAVVGGTMDVEFARTMLGVSDEAFLDAMDELRREELAVVQGSSLRIHHPRICEVVYQGTPTAERQKLHKQAAELIERWEQDDERDHAAELGNHFAEAGEERRALKYLVEAGDARYERFAYFDAREAYRRAFDLRQSAPLLQRGELERKLNDRLGRICFCHDHRHGPAYLERARVYHLRCGTLWAIPILSRLVGSAAAVAFCVATSVALNVLLLRPRPLRRPLERILDAFAALTYLSNCHTYSGRQQLALDASDRILPFVYSKRRMPRAGYLLARGFALVSMNRFDEAAAGSEEALAVLRTDRVTTISEHDRVHAEGGALVIRLWVDLIRGYAKTSRWWRPFEQHIRNHPTALLESWLMEVRVYSSFRQGNLAETEKVWKQFAEKATQAEVAFVLSKAKAYLGMAYLDLGRVSDAQDTADEVIQVGQALDNPMLVGLGLQLRGTALHMWEQLQDAKTCLEEAAELTARPDVACWELHHSILLGIAAVELDRGDLANVKRLTRSVLARNAALVLAHDLHCCRANRLLGKVALAEGDVGAAAGFFERALALASEIDDNLERARSLHFLAKSCDVVGDSVTAERCRADCEQLLTEIGNRYQLRRLGYAKTAEPESSGNLDVLTRVRRLVNGSTSVAGGTPIEADNGSDVAGSLGPQGSLLGVANSALRDETLVAADTTDSALPIPR